MFQSVILAGGFGARLKSISGEVPKPMVIVGGEPFLYRLMREQELQGCEKIILSLHYRAEFIVKKIQIDKPVSCKVEFAIEETPLGTGGAIKHACSLVTSDKFIVLNGDTYTDINYNRFYFQGQKSDLLVAAVNVDNVQRYGKIFIDSDFNVLDMTNKNNSGPGLINAGSYVVNYNDINSFPQERFSFENDFIKNYEGSFKAYISGTEFVDIGVPSDYIYACKRFS